MSLEWGAHALKVNHAHLNQKNVPTKLCFESLKNVAFKRKEPSHLTDEIDRKQETSDQPCLRLCLIAAQQLEPTFSESYFGILSASPSGTLLTSSSGTFDLKHHLRHYSDFLNDTIHETNVVFFPFRIFKPSNRTTLHKPADVLFIGKKWGKSLVTTLCLSNAYFSILVSNPFFEGQSFPRTTTYRS